MTGGRVNVGEANRDCEFRISDCELRFELQIAVVNSCRQEPLFKSAIRNLEVPLQLGFQLPNGLLNFMSDDANGPLTALLLFWPCVRVDLPLKQIPKFYTPLTPRL